MPEFTGFPVEATTFIQHLAQHNSPQWFERHRDEYHEFLLRPARAFVGAAGSRLRRVAPVDYEPRVNGSIFRINRDMRFARERYKDYLDLWFWQGDRPRAVSGFYLRVGATETTVAAGRRVFDREHLAAYRKALTSEEAATKLARLAKRIERKGYAVRGERYRTVPRDLQLDTPDQRRFAKHHALWTEWTVPHPDELRSADLVDWVIVHWRAMAPLHRWLVDQVRL